MMLAGESARMSQAFNIAVSPTRLLLHGEKAEVTFSVTNKLGRTVKLTPSIVAEGATQADWLTITNPPVELASEQTTTVTVRVDLPHRTEAGTYLFRLVAASHTDPSNESTSSPAVALEV